MVQKFNSLYSQGGEAAQWRDRVRETDSELSNLRTQVQNKAKELERLHQQIASHAQDINLKDSLIREGNEAIAKVSIGILIYNEEKIYFVNYF